MYVENGGVVRAVEGGGIVVPVSCLCMPYNIFLGAAFVFEHISMYSRFSNKTNKVRYIMTVHKMLPPPLWRVLP